MNLKYMKFPLFEISYKKKKLLFHNILIYWDAPVTSFPITLYYKLFG